MGVWQKVLIYAIIVGCYIALHEVFFRARFKIMLFTLLYVLCASIALIFAFRFNDLFVWMLVVNSLYLIAYFAYAVAFIKRLRRKLSDQVSQGKSMDEIMKTMSEMLGRKSKGAESEEDSEFGYGEIKAEEVEEEEEEPQEAEKKDFNVGDIIIDEKNGDEKNKDDKEDN